MKDESMVEDFLSYCPVGLRRTDQPSTRAPKHIGSQSRKRGRAPKFTAKRIYVFLGGVQIYNEPRTVSEIAELQMIPVGTINATISRNGKTRDGYSFEVVANGT